MDLGLVLAHTRFGGALGLEFLGFPSRAPWLFVLAVHAALLGSALAPGVAWRVARFPGRAEGLAIGATLLATGLAIRIGLTVTLGMPDAGPDTTSYISPALAHPVFPFSEVRTAGTPLLVALAHRGWGHPVGVLWLHHVLWLTSSIALVCAARWATRSRAVALTLLAYLCLCEKNLAFEYLLLSEHAARTCNALLLAASLWWWSRPSAWRALGVAFALLASMLAKPTALFMLPSLALLFAWAPGKWTRGRVTAHLAIVVVACLSSWATYSTEYSRRFGYWGTNAATYMNLYAHVGHLTDVEAVDSPELAMELARLIPRYRQDFADHGDHQPNWLIYGSVSPALRARFGDDSPAAAVERERLRSSSAGETRQHGLERIYRELALEGIRAHPVDYAFHAAGSACRLYAHGLGGSYRWDGLTGAAGDRAALVARDARIDSYLMLAYAQAGSPVPRPGTAEPASGPSAGALGAAVVAVGAVAACCDLAFVLAPLLLVLLVATSGAHAWRPGHTRRLRLLAFLTVYLGGYAAGIGLLCMSDAERFAVNVQDGAFLFLAVTFGLVTSHLRTAARRGGARPGSKR